MALTLSIGGEGVYAYTTSIYEAYWVYYDHFIEVVLICSKMFEKEMYRSNCDVIKVSHFASLSLTNFLKFIYVIHAITSHKART